MEKLKRIWFRIVARSLVKKLASREDDYQTILNVYTQQNQELQELKKPRPLDEDVNMLLRKSLNHKLEQDGILKNQRETQYLKGRIDILSRNLKQELAYIAYLEDMIRPHYNIDFNGLPPEKRQEYFERVERLL